MVLSHDNEYRVAAERFVTGHAGSSMGLVFAVTAVPPLSYFLRSLLVAHLEQSNPRTFARLEAPWFCFLFDLVILVLPVLISYFSVELLSYIIAAQVFAATVLMASYRHNLAGLTMETPRPTLNGPRYPFITQVKVGLMISTTLAILAVDFPAFPRAFVKTETFGTALMDIGVGSFIFTHALTGYRRRASLRSAVISVAPLLIIGGLRAASLRAVNYQMHTSEYGTHWNFFVTLAAVAVTSSLLQRACPKVRSHHLGVAVLGVYQLWLSLGGGTEYVIKHPRSNLLHANKEGITSTAGYLALHLLSGYVSEILIGDNDTNVATTKATNAAAFPTRSWHRRLWRLVALDIALWVLTWLLHSYVQISSRRMTNAAYVVWMMAHNTFQLVCALATQLVVMRPEARPSVLFSAIGRNSLPFFMLCNLLTGAVNLAMHTIYADAITACIVMICYITAASAAALVLRQQNISLKVW
jgi:phosphatidylinositol glycan class W